MMIGTALILQISRVMVDGLSHPNPGSINPAVMWINKPSLAMLLLHSTLATISAGSQKRSLVAPRRNSPGWITISSSSSYLLISVIVFESVVKGFKIRLLCFGKNLISLASLRSKLAHTMCEAIASRVSPSGRMHLIFHSSMRRRIVPSLKIITKDKSSKYEHSS